MSPETEVSVTLNWQIQKEDDMMKKELVECYQDLPSQRGAGSRLT